MNYKEFNDYELLDQIYSCSEEANEILLYKYRPLIVSLAKKYIKNSKGGFDLNDFIQEGLLALNDAINSFRDELDANFGTYAKLCIERKMNNLIKSSKTYKNKILNEYVSLEDDLEKPIDLYLADNSNNPSDMIIDFEAEKDLIEKLKNSLSEKEKEVLEYKLKGFKVKEIAEILNRDIKSIDNCVQRIKLKFKKIIK